MQCHLSRLCQLETVGKMNEICKHGVFVLSHFRLKCSTVIVNKIRSIDITNVTFDENLTFQSCV